MKVYFGSDRQSWCISRITNALGMYLPAGFESVSDPQEAELIILHVTGRNRHTTTAAQEILKQGKSYAVIQYAMKSTRNPDPADWMELWNSAKVVWSYYDLPAPNFYQAPLAAGSDVFQQMDTDKLYMVGTVGNCYQAECIGEVHLAVWQTSGMAVHIGEKFNDSPTVSYVQNISDDNMCILINTCNHFSSLRRKEGFEMPAVEALLCGVRPIMFDTPNYRQWFDGLAEFIPEAGISETFASLKKIFKRKPRPVTDDEIAETRKRFNWERSVKGFWERCAT
jgi:hypothetical protein